MAVFHSSMPRLRGRLVAVLVASLLLAACDRGPAALPAESLQIRINLLCTTCDDFLRCERRVDVEADLGTDSPQIYRIYRLREKTFWAQIATIWDYLVQWLQRKTSDERPLTVYLNDGDARSMLDISGSARVDAAVGLISLPDSICAASRRVDVQPCRGAKATPGYERCSVASCRRRQRRR
jgi:hypothetical protein